MVLELKPYYLVPQPTSGLFYFFLLTSTLRETYPAKLSLRCNMLCARVDLYNAQGITLVVLKIYTVFTVWIHVLSVIILLQKNAMEGNVLSTSSKTFFVEIRTFWHIFRSFDRMWAFYILGLQVCCSFLIDCTKG